MFVGLHPTELTDNPDGAIAVVRRELESCIRYVGVGEIGIDLHEDAAGRENRCVLSMRSAALRSNSGCL